MVGKDEISELYDLYFNIKTCDIEYLQFIQKQNLKKDSIRYAFDTNVLDMNMNERIRPSTIASSAHNDIAVR